ncbi:MAG: hypothetical protein CMF41_01885 [Legionellales bacterium]|nr:hypothetical protein [Legionellales bacterium]OUX65903.1 MAG: hypothetical protein CBE41_01080 [Gammaproteobacteria bacterium TMED281]
MPAITPPRGLCDPDTRREQRERNTQNSYIATIFLFLALTVLVLAPMLIPFLGPIWAHYLFIGTLAGGALIAGGIYTQKSAENTKNNIPVFTILIALILILSVAFPPVGAGILGLFAAVPILSAALTGAAAGLSTAIPIMSGLAITVSSIVSFAVGTYAIDKSTHFIERSKNAFKQLFDKFSNRDTNPIETNEQSNVPPSLNSHR